MKSRVLLLVIVLVGLNIGSANGEYSFGQWAVDTGLSSTDTIAVMLFICT